MKKIFLAIFLLVFCACSQNGGNQNSNQSTEQNSKIYKSTKKPSLDDAKKACENKEKNACITAASMMLGKADSSADELKEIYKLTQKGCEISEDISCVYYAQALLFGIFDDENTKEGLKALKNSCQNGGAMSCANLGDIYFFGHFGQNKDKQKAKLYLEKICQNSKDFCPMAKAMEQRHAQMLKTPNIAVPAQNFWISQSLVREKKLKSYELGEAPEGVVGALGAIDFFAGTQEKLVCDEPESTQCKSFLDEQCKEQENEQFCRGYLLRWNASKSGVHEKNAVDGARYFLEKVVNEYNKDEFIYFVKYAYNKHYAISDLLSLTAGYDENSGDELPLILALSKNNLAEQLQEIRRIYGESSGDAKLMGLFRQYKISPKLAKILTK